MDAVETSLFDGFMVRAGEPLITASKQRYSAGCLNSMRSILALQWPFTAAQCAGCIRRGTCAQLRACTKNALGRAGESTAGCSRDGNEGGMAEGLARARFIARLVSLGREGKARIFPRPGSIPGFLDTRQVDRPTNQRDHAPPRGFVRIRDL